MKPLHWYTSWLKDAVACGASVRVVDSLEGPAKLFVNTAKLLPWRCEKCMALARAEVVDEIRPGYAAKGEEGGLSFPPLSGGHRPEEGVVAQEPAPAAEPRAGYDGGE